VGACDSFYVHGIAEKDTYIAGDTVGPVEEGKYARLTSALASCLSLSLLGSRSSILLPDTGLWVVNFKKKRSRHDTLRKRTDCSITGMSTKSQPPWLLLFRRYGVINNNSPCLPVLRGCLGTKFFCSFGRILQYSQILQYYIHNGVWQAR
jgi:hypothetical protein